MDIFVLEDKIRLPFSPIEIQEKDDFSIFLHENLLHLFNFTLKPKTA